MQPCEVCGAEGTFKCSKCGSAYYCSAEHQRQAWKSHRPLCAQLLAAAGGGGEAAAAEEASIDPVAGAASSSSTVGGVDAPGVSRPSVPAGPPRDGDGSVAAGAQQPQPQLQPPHPAQPSVLAAPKNFNSMGLLEGSCFYINLDRRTDRRAGMERLASGHRWLAAHMARVEAVDGKDLSWPQLVGNRLLAPEAEAEALRAERLRRPTGGGSFGERSCHMTLGACACALSHRKAWQALVDSDAGWALVLEDDISAVCQRFDDELVAVLRVLPAAWQLCYLGFHAGEMLPQGSSFAGPFIHLNSDSGWVPGLYGYLVTKAFAKTLLRRTLPLTAQLDAVVGCLAAGLGDSYAVPSGQLLVLSAPPEESRDTDVQTFAEDMK